MKKTEKQFLGAASQIPPKNHIPAFRCKSSANNLLPAAGNNSKPNSPTTRQGLHTLACGLFAAIGAKTDAVLLPSTSLRTRASIPASQLVAFLFSLALMAVANTTTAQTLITDIDDLRDAINNAKPGDEIIMKDGVYEGNGMTIYEVKGTAEKPIVIRAETPLGVELYDQASFDLRQCEHLVFSGFTFTSTDRTVFKLQSCHYVRITRNHFNLQETKALKWIRIQGIWDDPDALSSHNRIDHNLFENKTQAGNFITVDGTVEPSYLMSQHDRIDHNHFKKNQPRIENEKESIRVGASNLSESSGFTVIEHNLFEECDGDPEIISIKCDDNVVRYNTFRRCKGTLSLRHGDRSTIAGNFFLGEGVEGTGGVRIYGDDHLIINNHFQNLTGTKWDAPITLTYGDAESGSSSLSKHFRINRAVIANNTLINNDYGIEIGYDNTEKYDKPPRDVLFAYNVVSGQKNQLILYRNPADEITWKDNLFYPTGEAILGYSLSASEAQQADPKLNLDGYWKATANTPSQQVDAAYAWKPLQDIQGHTRTGNNTLGADQWSADEVLYAPKTMSDVGPFSDESNFLSVSPSSFLAEAAATQFEIQLNSDLDWNISTDADWLSLDKTSGSKSAVLTVSIAENTAFENRTAQLTFTAGQIIEHIGITQQAKVSTAQLSLSAYKLLNNHQATSQELSLSATTDWSIAHSPEWISVSPNSGTTEATLQVDFHANSSTGLRRDSLVFRSEDKKAVLLLQQDGTYSNEIPISISAATATHVDGTNVAENVFDNDLASRWSGQGDGTHITLELDDSYKLSYVEIAFYKGDQRQTSFDIQLSENGIDFDTALEMLTSTSATTDLERFNFEDANAKYIRIVGHGNTSNDWNSLNEIKVWGTEAASETLSTRPIKTASQVFPTVVRHTLYGTSTEKVVRLTVYAANGSEQLAQPIQTGTNGQFQLSVEALKNGMYFLRVESSTRTETHRFVKAE